MPSARPADDAMRRRRRQAAKAGEASRRLGRAERDLEQARRDRREQQRKTAEASEVSRSFDLVEARNDISGLIADIFGFGGTG